MFTVKMANGLNTEKNFTNCYYAVQIHIWLKLH